MNKMSKRCLAVAAMAAAVSSAPAQEFWTNTVASANWSVGTNWADGSAANAVDASVTITNQVTANRTITVDGQYTVGSITIGSPGGNGTNLAYTVSASTSANSGNNFLTFDVSSGQASITIVGTTNSGPTFTVPMKLNDDLLVDFATSGTVGGTGGATINGNIFGAADRTLTYRNSSTVTAGSRYPLSIANGYDEFLGDLVIDLGSTSPAGGGADLQFSTYAGSHVDVRVISTNSPSTSSARLRFQDMPRIDGTLTLDAGTQLQLDSNQGSAPRGFLTLGGAIVGGGDSATTNSYVRVQGNQEVKLANPDATSTVTTEWQVASGQLSFERDDQLGAAQNDIRLSVGNGAQRAGILIRSNVTLGADRKILLGSHTGVNSGGNIATLPGVELTLTESNQIDTAGGTQNGINFSGMGSVRFKDGGSMNGAAFSGGTGDRVFVGSRLIADNTGTANLTNRLADDGNMRYSFRGGSLEMIGATNADSSETIGAVVLHSGGNKILTGNGAGFTNTLTLKTVSSASLTREQDIQYQARAATVSFDALPGADAVGSANNQIILSTAPTLTNGIMGAWARVGNDWAAHDGNGTSVRAYTNYTAFAGAGAADNAEISGGAVETLGGAKSVNTVKFTGSNTLDLANNTLDIGAGGILNTGAGSALNNTGGDNTQLRSGPTGTNELIITDNGSLTVNAALGDYFVVKTGTGTTFLASSANNQKATVINEGTLAVGSDAALGQAMAFGGTNLLAQQPRGFIAIAGGTLRATSSFTMNRVIVAGGASSNNTFASGFFAPARVEVDGGVVLTTTNKISGGGGAGVISFIKGGDGVFELFNPSTATSGNILGLQTNSAVDMVGDYLIEGGTLRVTNTTVLGLNVGNNNQTGNDVYVKNGAALEISNAAVQGITFTSGGGDARAFIAMEGGGVIRGAGATHDLNWAFVDSIREEGGPLQFEGTLNLFMGANSSGGEFTPGQTFRMYNTNHSYTGDTTVQAGTLLIGANAPSGANGALGNSTNAVRLGLGGSSAALGVTIAALIESNGVTVGRDFTVNNSNAEGLGRTVLGAAYTNGSSTFSGSVTMNRSLELTSSNAATVNFTGNFTDGAGSFAVRKTGSGIVNLTGSNRWDGGTFVSNGTLLANNAVGSATGTNFVNVYSGGALGGTGIIAGAVNVLAGGTLTPGNSPGTLTVSNNLDLAAGSFAEFEINGTNAGEFDRVVGMLTLDYGGTLTLDFGFTFTGESNEWDLFDFSVGQTNDFGLVQFAGNYAGAFALSGDLWSASVGGYDWTFNELDGILSVAVIPEPATVAMFVMGALALAAARRRK